MNFDLSICLGLLGIRSLFEKSSAKTFTDLVPANFTSFWDGNPLAVFRQRKATSPTKRARSLFGDAAICAVSAVRDGLKMTPILEQTSISRYRSFFAGTNPYRPLQKFRSTLFKGLRFWAEPSVTPRQTSIYRKKARRRGKAKSSRSL